MFKRTRHVHFVGIGGIGMSGIAEVLLTLGYRVTGSDIKESARVRNLERRGADVRIGHAPSNVEGADVVVMTSAVDESNPEVQEARNRSIPVIPRAEMLAELMRLQEGIAVAGTHGKTTTTAMVSKALQAGDCDPTVVVGGRLHNLSIGARLGTDDQIVVEADESDGSFLKLSPVMGVVTNIEAEHMDYYDDLAALKSAFLDFINSVPFYGFTGLCGDDPVLSSLLPEVKKPFRTYGFDESNSLRAVDRRVRQEGTKFTVLDEGEELGTINLQVPGSHNILNALGAASIALEQGIAFKQIKHGLEDFKGVARRFDFKGEAGGLKVYDDYAHHPTEIEATLRTAKERFDSELIVIFQPHRYSRTRDFADEYGPALKQADRLLVTDVYPAGEDPLPGIDLDFLRDRINPHRNGHITEFRSDETEILNWTKQNIEPDTDQVLFTMGAGDVVDLAEPILDFARKETAGT
ncbi:MAG: UDP-N-acetylmuramate--L-alanine ligase [bacterium]